MADLRRRRLNPPEDVEAQEEALVQLETELPEVYALEDQDKSTSVEENQLEVFEHPAGPPMTLMPVAARPLFSPAQMRELEDAQRKASHLYGGPQGLPEASPPRPKFLEDETAKPTAPQEGLTEASGEAVGRSMEKALGGGLGGDPGNLMKMVYDLYQENQMLRNEMTTRELDRGSLEAAAVGAPKEKEGEFATPEELKPEVERARDELYALTPMEQFQRLQQMMDEATEGRNGRDLGASEPRGRPLLGPSEITKTTPMRSTSRRASSLPRGQGHRTTEGAPLGGGSQGEERMQKQLDVVTKMMMHLLENKHSGGVETMEQVRPGTSTLPQLSEPGETAPIDFADWVTTIEPAMQDLSDGSHVWWDHIIREAKAWYQEYVKLRPLQRTQYEVVANEELRKTRWVRVERRAVSMVMSAVPGSIRGELVATKSLTPLKIVCKLMTVYQPGGLHEKQVILQQLENPGEASSAATGVSSLRRWLRWLRRAEDVGLSLPDASILLRGLTRLMKKLLSGNPEMSFRSSLIRSTLQLDTIPNHGTVRTYSEHLLSELEQMVHIEKKGRQAAGTTTSPGGAQPPVAKQMESNGHTGGHGGYQRPTPPNPGGARGTEEVRPCKFYLTDQGCRKGKNCKWSHELKDDKRRCFTCGSTGHMANNCPTKGDAPKVQRLQESTVGTAGAQDGGDQADAVNAPLPNMNGEEKPTSGKENDGIKELLMEANKMLRGMNVQQRGATSSSTAASSTDYQDRVRELRDELLRLQRQGATGNERKIRAVMIARIETSEKGLLDTGATHAMRGRGRKEVPRGEQVGVTLAGGEQVWMHIND